MANRYLEKIASWGQEEESLVKFAELSDLEKQAFFKAIAKMFARKPTPPKAPAAPKPPKPPAQPSTTPHNGNVPKLQSALAAERKARATKFATANKTAGKPAWFTLG